MKTRISNKVVPITILLLKNAANTSGFSAVGTHVLSKASFQSKNRAIRMSSESEDFEDKSWSSPSIKSPYTFTGTASELFDEKGDSDTFPSSWSKVYQKNQLGDGLQGGAIISYLSCVLLVTSNTVGGGMLVLPEVVSGAGMHNSLFIFMMVYCINLLSGAIIGEVAIQQYENAISDSDVTEHAPPSSFKALAEELSDDKGGLIVGTVSILLNWCFLAFNYMGAGNLLSSVTDVFPSSVIASIAFCTFVSGLLATQNDEKISKVSSCAATVLFTSFAALLLPGLLHIQQDPFTVPPLNEGANLFSSIATVAPLLTGAMLYQNIVPTVTKLLDYDRFKVNTALMLGTAIPTLMYIAWCYTMIGGGIGGSGAGDISSLFMNSFSMAAMGGTSIATTLTVTKEFQSLLTSSNDGEQSLPNISDNATPEKSASLPSVLLAVVPPFLVGATFSHGESFTAALDCAGSYLAPTMYGLLPVFFAHKLGLHKTMPGGIVGISVLALSASSLMGQHFMNQVGAI